VISIEPADRWRQCSCCYSEQAVKNIQFPSNSFGTSIALCSECRAELKQKLIGVEDEAE